MTRGALIRFMRIVLCAALGALTLCAPAFAQVIINELCASNKTLWTDSFGIYADYAELYNPGGADVCLEGYALSDGGDAHVFGADCVVPARGYLMISLSGRSVAGDTSHAPFKLSSGVIETLTLYNPQGAEIDSAILPPTGADMAFSRQSEGGFAITPGSPGRENPAGDIFDASALANKPLVLPPTLSHASGFYDEPFSLSLSARQGLTIYYTLNCETPSPSAHRYTGTPIPVQNVSARADTFASITDISLREYSPPARPVDKALVVRAVAVDDMGNMSAAVTGVYFVGYQALDIYKGMAIASLVTDPACLFDADTGIYVKGSMYETWLNSPDYNPDIELTDTPANFFMSGREWERPAVLTFFDDNHDIRLTQDIGIRMHGNYSRNQLQKSFNLYARREYGAGTFKYRFFDGLTLDTLMLRAARNTDEYLRDPLTQSFCAELNVGIQHAIHCMLFINGEFWGVYELREKQNARYVSEMYDVPEDNVVLIKNSQLDKGSVFGRDAYKQMLAFVNNNDMNDMSNYAQLCDMIDMRSYLDYVCAEIFIGNVDWPNNNELLWRTLPAGGEGYDDGRWRWLVFDFDQVMGYGAHPPTLDSLKNAQRNSMFASLWRSERFREEFCEVFTNLANTCFHPESVVSALSALNEWLAPRMDAQKARFDTGFSNKQRLATVADYAAFVNGRFGAMATILAPERPPRALALGESAAGAGEFTVNSYAPVMARGAWRGLFFDGDSVSVSARANEGYQFKHWELDGEVYTDALITFDMRADRALTAVYYELDQVCPVNQARAAGGALLALYPNGDMALSSASGWQAGDGIDIIISTAGAEAPEAYFELAGGNKAPRDWALSYSLDGENFIPVDGAAWSISSGEAVYARAALPRECADSTSVALRLLITSGYCVSGKQKLYGSESGEAALAGFSVRAARAPRSFAAYNDVYAYAQSLSPDYPRLASAMQACAPGAQAAQEDIDAAARALTRAIYQALLNENTQTLAQFASGRDIYRQIAVELCARAPVYTVTPQMAALSERAPVPAPYAGDILLYALNESGRFEFSAALKRYAPDIVYLPSARGVYLALPEHIERYAIKSYEFSPYALTDAQAAAWFSGFPPDELISLKLEVTEEFGGECELPLADWREGAVIYVYRARGDALEFAGEAEHALGKLRLKNITGGEYLLASQSVEVCLSLAARRDAARGDAARGDSAARSASESGDASALKRYLPIAAPVAILIMGILIFLIRKSKKNKTNGGKTK